MGPVVAVYDSWLSWENRLKTRRKQLTTETVIHLANGKFTGESSEETVKVLVDRAFDEPKAGGVAVHFHGGLVSRAAGMRKAEELGKVYSDAEALPVFFVWESGLFETVTNNLRELASESLFKTLFKRIRKIVERKFAKKDSGRSGTLPEVDTYDTDKAIDQAFEHIALGKETDAKKAAKGITEVEAPKDLTELTKDEMNTLEAELKTDGLLTAEIESVSQGLLDEATIEEKGGARSPIYRVSSATMMDPKALEKYVKRPADGARGIIDVAAFIKGVITVAYNVIERFIKNRDHGLHATIVEELLHEFYLANIGQVVWTAMKKDTKDSFGDDPKQHGGTAFLEHIRQRVEVGDTPPRFTLIGHSTGAVYICHLLEKANVKNLPKSVQFDVVLLAPASNFELTATAVAEHSNRIRNFRMFTMSDKYEKDDELVPVLYPHSLLYFLSGVVDGDPDTPIIGMARFYEDADYPASKFKDVETVRDYVRAAAERAVWSVEDHGEGLQTAATTHGGFDDERKTLESLKHILREGF